MKHFLLLFLLVGFASSCRHLPIDPPDPNDPGKPRDTTKPVIHSLAGTSWQLDPQAGRHPLEEIYTLKFSSETEAGGQAACNSYGVEYKADNGNISFRNLISTKAYCGDHSFNDEYYGLLHSALTYKIEGDKLFIETRDMNNGVRFLIYSRTGNGDNTDHKGPGVEYKPLVQWLDFSVVKIANDPFEIVKTQQIDETHIGITVQYGGGCGMHSFYLAADKGFKLSHEKMDINLMLVHRNNGDVCKALITETLVFDIAPVVGEWKGGYCAGNLNMNIMGAHNTAEMSISQ